MHLLVDDADAAIEHAVQAGATLVQAATNQFYGDRSGRVTDTFGYTWTIAMRREEMSVPEMQRRMAEMMAQQMPQTAASYRREGFRAVTPYIVVNDAAGLIEFTKRAFGAEETMRADLPGGGVHGEVRIGDSMLMVGVPSAAYGGQRFVTAFHLYVPDCDAVCRRAVDEGATLVQAPVDARTASAAARSATRSAIRGTSRRRRDRATSGASAHAERVSASAPRRAAARVPRQGVRRRRDEKFATRQHRHARACAHRRRLGRGDGRSARREIQPTPTMFYL